MSNGTHSATGVVTYRVVRELGKRTQRVFAAVRDPHELVVLNRFTRVEKDAAMSTGVDIAATSVSAEQLAVLLRDAGSLAKNWHPNIARVKHVDLVQGSLSIATDLLDGTTLADLVALTTERKVAFPLDVLVRVLLDVLAGVHGIHSLRDARAVPLGAIHGELCPTNIVVGKDGVARVINTFRPRPVRIAVGSEALGYAAPETLDGGAQDARVDIYAVGVILWEVLTGTRLHDEKEPARVLARQRGADIARPAVPSDIAYAPLAHVAMRALSFEPSLRFRTAMEMATALRALPPARIAAGSVVAARVNELDGERIRGRRATLDRSLASRPRLTAAISPPAESSGDRVTVMPETVSSRQLVDDIEPTAVRADQVNDTERPPPPVLRPRAKLQLPSATAKGLGSATTTAKGLGEPPVKAPSSNPIVVAKKAPSSNPIVVAKKAPSSNPIAVAKKAPSSNPVVAAPPAPSSKPVIAAPTPPPAPAPSSPIVAKTPPVPSSSPVIAAPPAPSSSPIAVAKKPPVPPPVVVAPPPPPPIVALAPAPPSSGPVIAAPPATDSSRFLVDEALAARRDREKLAANTSGLVASVDLDEAAAGESAPSPPPRKRRGLIVVAAVLLVATLILVFGMRSGSRPPPEGVTSKPPATPTSVAIVAPVATAAEAPVVTAAPATVPDVAAPASVSDVAPAASPSGVAAPTSPSNVAPAVRPPVPSTSTSTSTTGRATVKRRYEPLGI
jgi:hypothetical protein